MLKLVTVFNGQRLRFAMTTGRFPSVLMFALTSHAAHRRRDGTSTTLQQQGAEELSANKFDIGKLRFKGLVTGAWRGHYQQQLRTTVQAWHIIARLAASTRKHKQQCRITFANEQEKIGAEIAEACNTWKLSSP